MVKSIINTGSKILRRILSRNPLGNYVILIQFSGQSLAPEKRKISHIKFFFALVKGYRCN